VQGTVPWLKLRSVSGILILVGHLAFAVLLLLNLLGRGWTRRGPALLKDDQARYAELVREKEP
jgi:hypothetical protein